MWLFISEVPNFVCLWGFSVPWASKHQQYFYFVVIDFCYALTWMSESNVFQTFILVLLHLIPLAQCRGEYDGMNIYHGSWLWWAMQVGEKKKKKKQSVKSLVLPFLAWLTLLLAASNSFWEGGTSALLLSQPKFMIILINYDALHRH